MVLSQLESMNMGWSPGLENMYMGWLLIAYSSSKLVQQFFTCNRYMDRHGELCVHIDHVMQRMCKTIYKNFKKCNITTEVLKLSLLSFITAGLILLNWVTLAVELGKGVVVEVRSVRLGVLSARGKLARRRSISISRLLLCN